MSEYESVHTLWEMVDFELPG
eukprot:COSAG02_NODE_51364_length_314_cov_1.195349_2_plen_20_part_01